MNDMNANKTPWHLWAVGLLTLLWNAIGCFNYLMTRLDKLDTLGMSAEQIAYFQGFPVWANALWALGVWGAFFGSLLLLLRSRHAVTSFAIAIIGLIGTTIYQQAMSDIPAELDNIGLALLVYAIAMRRNGVLR